MNSNLHTTPKKFCLHVFTYCVVVSLIVSLGSTVSVRPDLVGITPGQGREDITQKKMFLRTKSHRALEILEDGSVRGTACADTKFSLLQSGSHNLGNTVFGKAANRYLCVTPDGVVYSLPKDKFDEDDCVFNETVEYEHFGEKSNPGYREYSKYRHKKHGIRLGKSVRKYHLALVCNKAITVSMKKHRLKYENETLFLVDRTNKDLLNLQETNCKDPSTVDLSCKKKTSYTKKCSEQLKRRGSNGRSNVKFCRKVMKNFFSATLRQLRLFRKRDCYTVLSEYNKCRRRRRQRRQQRKGPS